MALKLLINTEDEGLDGLLNSFSSRGKAQTGKRVRGDKSLAFQIIPVKPSAEAATRRPWDSDFVTGDEFQVAISNADEMTASGTFKLGYEWTAAGITSSSGTSPIVITTSGAHDLSTGDLAVITGHSSDADINGTVWEVTVLSGTTYSINASSLTGGTGGSSQGYRATTALAYNASAATLEAALIARIGGSSVHVESLAEGQYRITNTTAGGNFTFVGYSSSLSPQSAIYSVQTVAGSLTTYGQSIVTLRKAPVAYAEPTTLLPSAGVTPTAIQAGSSTTNRRYSVALTPDTYDGTFSVELNLTPSVAIATSSVANPSVITTTIPHGYSTGDSVTIAGHSGETPSIDSAHTITRLSETTFSIPVNVTVAGTGGTASKAALTNTAGVVRATMSEAEVGNVLKAHPYVRFAETDGTPNNVVITRVTDGWLVEFANNLGNSASQILATTNIDLLAPKGVRGVINLNTVNLFEDFAATTEPTLTYKLAIRRIRADGEEREFFQSPITLLRNIVDPTTMIPLALPSYITSAQAASSYQPLDANLTSLSDGQLALSRTITAAGVTGAQTINNASGRVNFAAGSMSLVVTNSLVTSDSIIFAFVQKNDATAVLDCTEPALGSFTIHMSVSPTAETSVAFLVTN